MTSLIVQNLALRKHSVGARYSLHHATDKGADFTSHNLVQIGSESRKAVRYISYRQRNTTRKRTTMRCYICGQEFKEHELNMIFTGRTHYVCDKCLKDGRTQAENVRSRVIERIRKEQNP